MVVLNGEVLEGVADHGDIDGLHLLHFLCLVFYLRPCLVLILGLYL